LKLIKNKSELVGTCYFELMPRKYDGKPWNDDSVYLTEQAFKIIEPAFEYSLKNYDCFSFMIFGLEEVNKICDKLGDLVLTISAPSSYSDSIKLLNSNDQTSSEATKMETLALISEKKNWLESTKKSTSTFSLLGI